MKKLILTYFILFSSFCFTQTITKTDSTQICLPYQVGRRILIELNDGDRNKELLRVSNQEIKLLKEKVIFKDSTIMDLKKTIEIADQVSKKNEEKFKIVNEDNETLRKDNNLLKLKNTISNIVSGIVIGILTYEVVKK
jgi:hypothetical protein